MKTKVMIRLYLSAIAFMAITLSTYAQSYEGTIQYDKKKQAALVIEFAYPSEAVENAFIQRMEKLGYKVKEEKGILNRDKGFLVFKNAYILDISQDKMDYLVKVDRKSRKEDDQSVLYLVIQKDGENVINKIDAYDLGRAKAYLNEMLPDIEAANLELQIKAQEDAIGKAEKKLKGLQDDKIDLEKKLEANEKDQDETIKDLEQQRQSLINLKGRRKSER